MYNHQRIYVNQVIYNFWIRMQEGILEKIRRKGKPVRLTGDGQYDSPGHNARYCFYTMIESVSKLVLDFYIAEKTMVSVWAVSALGGRGVVIFFSVFTSTGIKEQ